MGRKNNKDRTLSIAVTNDLFVKVIPDARHYFLMTTNQVTVAYQISYDNAKKIMADYDSEFIEGVHFIRGGAPIGGTVKTGGAIQPDKAKSSQIFWTKAGVIRLGFFIKSQNDKLIREWADRLILSVERPPSLYNSATIQIQEKVAETPHNPLTLKNIMSIIADVCEIQDEALKARILSKLTGEGVITWCVDQLK